MAFCSNIIRSLNAKQFIAAEKSFFVIFGRHIHSNLRAIKMYSMDMDHLSFATKVIACASYKSTRNLREIVKHTLIDNDESTKVRIMPSRKPIPLPEDDFTNTMLRKNYSRPI